MSRFLSGVDSSHGVDTPQQSWVSTMLVHALSSVAELRNLLVVRVTIGRSFLHQKELFPKQSVAEILDAMEARHWESLVGVYQEIFRLLNETTDVSVDAMLSSKPNMERLVDEFEIIVTRCAPNEVPDDVTTFQLCCLCQQFYTLFFCLQEIKSLQEKVVEQTVEVDSDDVASGSSHLGAQSGTRSSTQTNDNSVEIIEVSGPALTITAVDPEPVVGDVGDTVVPSAVSGLVNQIMPDVQPSSISAIAVDPVASTSVRDAMQNSRWQSRVGLLASGVVALGVGGFGVGMLLAKRKPDVHHRPEATVQYPRAISPSPVRAITPPAVVLPSLPVQSVDQALHEAGLVNNYTFYTPSIRTGVIGAMVANSDHTRLCLPVGHQTPRDLGVYILGVAHIIGYSPTLLQSQWHIDRAALGQYRLNLSWSPRCDRFTLTLRNGTGIQATTVFGMSDPTFIVTRLNRPVDAAFVGVLSQ